MSQVASGAGGTGRSGRCRIVKNFVRILLNPIVLGRCCLRRELRMRAHHKTPTLGAAFLGVTVLGLTALMTTLLAVAFF